MTTSRHPAVVSLAILVLCSVSMLVLQAQTATRPRAFAGLNQRIPGIGITVRLDGSGSSDPAGRTLTYHWTLIETPPGSSATLTGADTVTSSFVPDEKGRYRAQLVVNNGTQSSNPDIVVVTVQNTPPLANAGTDLTAAIGQMVHLDGAASSDVDGDPLTYQWNFASRPLGSRAAFVDSTAAQPTFVVDRPGRYIARLVVRDGRARSADSVFIDVPNSAPVANAGPDQSASVDARVTLDGSGSSDVDGDRIRYTWTLTTVPAGSTARLTNRRAVHPTFVVDLPGRYVVELRVNDGLLDSGPDTVVISTGNSAPVANAGPDQSVLVPQVVHLDGSGSTDVDGNTLTFSWTFVTRPAGSAAQLVDGNTASPSFQVDRRGTYRVSLVVNDGLVDSGADIVEITVGNTAPVASAGPDQRITRGDTVTLDGSGSTDVDGDSLTYLWSLTSVPDGSTAALNNPNAVAPTFVADLSGSYVAQLIVSDGTAVSVADTVSVMTENVAPVARAGADQTGHIGQVVALNGSGSSDVDGDPLTYRWSFTVRPDGSTAPLTGTTSVAASFTPDLPGEYVVQLVVSDGVLTSTPDTSTINTTNSVPVANAGTDQNDVPLGSTVLLNGSLSNDADAQPLSYHWSLLTRPAGSTAAIDNVTGVSPTFVADIAGDYVAQLVVNDGVVDSAPDTVMIRTTRPPVASAGPDQEVLTGQTVQLDGGSSIDPDGEALTYLWSFTSVPSGSTAALAGPTTTSPTFVANVAGVYEVTLTVTNTSGETASDSVRITATTASPSLDVPVSVTFPDTEVGSVSDTFVELVSSGGAPVSITGASATGDFQIDTDSSTCSDQPLPSGESCVIHVTFTPSAVGARGGLLTVVSNAPSVGVVALLGMGTQAAPLATVTLQASDAQASEAGAATGAFVVSRGGSSAMPLTVNLTIGGTATNGTDYTTIASSVTIPAGQSSATILVTPIPDSQSESDETVVLSLATGSYSIGSPNTATVIIADSTPDGGTLINGANHSGAISTAGEVDTWTFTATAGTAIVVDIGETGGNTAFVPWIRLFGPSGSIVAGGNNWGALAAQIAVTAPATGTYTVLVASADSGNDDVGTYVLTSVRTAGPYFITPGDQGGALTNGGNHVGAIHVGDLDPWTFAATAGDTVLLNIGETGPNSAFVPWIRVFGPTGALVAGGNNWGDLAAQVAITAPLTGIYTVVVSTADSGNDDAGTYVLTMIQTPGAFTVPVGDEGGSLTNGGNHAGALHLGDLDAWTLNATAGETVVVNIGETGANSPFVPWIRVYGPTGALVAGGNNWGDLAAQVAIIAPSTGIYTVVVSTADSGNDATGTYQITAVHLAAPPVVSSGDEGGALTNGGNHTGTIHLGDLDPWTITATAGETIIANIGETGANSAFVPWIRVYSPTGTLVAGGNNWGDLAAQVAVVAPATGNYTILVSTADSGNDAVGTYVLTAIHLAANVVVSPGDEGDALTNGGNHSGTIQLGDLDPWKISATAGETLVVNIGETGSNSAFVPWIRVYGPTGTLVAGGNNWGDLAAQVAVIAPTTGVYTIVVSTADSGNDATGSYQLTALHLAGTPFISAGDEGGPLTNGGNHTGTLHIGDFDAWTIQATAGETIAANIGETGPNSAFVPWIRVYGPTGTLVAGGNNWGDLAAQVAVIAPTTGVYTILVSTADSGNDDSGSYVLAAIHLAGTPDVSFGDEGGPLSNGGVHNGTILLGDLDAWTFSAVAGQSITASIAETGVNTPFIPWIRIYGPSGTLVAGGNNWGDVSASVHVIAPASGTYTVLVSTADSGNDATGTYQLSVIR